jgi:hypothetical protein
MVGQDKIPALLMKSQEYDSVGKAKASSVMIGSFKDQPEFSALLLLVVECPDR